MKKTKNLLAFTLALLASATSSFGQSATGFPQATAFSYQGRLSDNGSPANGNFDLRFRLVANAATGAQPITSAPTLNIAPVAVANGLFTVTLNFGGAAFTGEDRFLEIGVRTNGTTEAHTVLTPLQPLLAVPYSIFSATAGNVPDGVVTGAKLAPGAVTTGVLGTPSPPANGQILVFNGSSLAWSNTTAPSSGWNLSGNSGLAPGASFLGTLDNQPLELRVNNSRGLRLEPNGISPNLIGGHRSNFVSGGIFGATIGGGGSESRVNQVLDGFGTVSGGSHNTSSGQAATVAGGQDNISSGFGATVGGGSGNASGGGASTVGGGNNNISRGESATVGGGTQNISSNAFATVPGGFLNIAGGISSFAAGQRASALHDGAFVWADGSGADFASSAPNQFLIRADGGVGIGTSTPSEKLDVNGNIHYSGQLTKLDVADNMTATLRAGDFRFGHSSRRGSPGRALVDSTDTLSLNFGGDWPKTFLGGNVGIGRQPASNRLEIEGDVLVTGSLKLGGQRTVITGFDGNGDHWFGPAPDSDLAFGLHRNGVNDFDFNVNGQVRAGAIAAAGVVRAAAFEGDGSGLTGITAATLDGLSSTGFWKLGGNTGGSPGTPVLGTLDNRPLELTVNNTRALRLEPTADSPNVIGGYPGNSVAAGLPGATIGGGTVINDSPNIVSGNGQYGTIAGGYQNRVTGYGGSVQGGGINAASADFASVGGGQFNTASASYSTVGGGLNNTASGNYSFVAGHQNTASGRSAAIGGGRGQQCDRASRNCGRRRKQRERLLFRDRGRVFLFQQHNGWRRKR